VRQLLPEHRFFIAMAVGVTGITIFAGSPFWYLSFMLLLLFFGILVLTRTWLDRGFYLACTGEPLVIACGIMNIWVGLFVVCMLAGIECGVLGLLVSRDDIRLYGVFCGISFLIAVLIQVSNHVLVPLLIIGVVTAAILAVQSIRMYQFRKQYSGGALT
jgi:hypothetical protein